MCSQRPHQQTIGELRDPNCSLCGLHKTAEFVCLLGQGPEPCDVAIIGEAPGKNEDASGKPFVGRSGMLLEAMLDKHGIDRRKVFITNAVGCRPPENRTPRKGEINKCSVWLDRQLDIIKPKYVLLLGNVPLQSIFGKGGIKKFRGKPRQKDGITYLPTYHPSFVIRDYRNAGAFETDIELFKEIITRGGIPREEGLNHLIVDTWEKFKQMMKELRGSVSFDIETTCLYPWALEAAITSLGFGTRKHQWTIPFTHADSPWDKKDLSRMVNQITAKLLRDCSIIAHNGKFDALWMRVHYGVEWPIDFDTMMAHFLLDENSFHSLKYLAKIYYGAPDYDLDTDKKKGATPYPELALYHAHDLFYTRKLRFTLGKKLFQEGDVKRVFQKIIMPCVNIFVDIEFNGVFIDVKRMGEVGNYLRKQLDEAEKELNKYTKKKEVNWGSPQQLGAILFEELGLEVVEYTKKGKYSTSESVLNRIDHPIRHDLLKYRGAKQQLSFFIEGWEPFLVDDYIHPSFKLHGTVTGRLSCEHPNLQQVPRDKTIRSLITAPKGWTLVECDLSQIELRIAAELSGDHSMTDAFNRGIDVHWLTAIREISRSGALPEVVRRTASKHVGKKLSYSEAIDVLLKMGPDKAVSIDEHWKEHRKKAKAINFGYLYGMWWKKFKQYALDNYGVAVTDEQAQASRVSYFDLYQQLPEWHERQKRYTRRNGYVLTLSGRKRRLPDATLGYDCPERRGAERQAINSPVQSFANELNLMAMIQLYNEFPRHILKIVGTIHDSVLFRVRDNYVEKVTARMLEIMTHPKLLDEFGIKMRIPIEAEEKLGPWGAGKSLSQWKKAA